MTTIKGVEKRYKDRLPKSFISFTYQAFIHWEAIYFYLCYAYVGGRGLLDSLSASILDNDWIIGCLLSGCSISLRLLGDLLRLLVDPYILLLPILLRIDSLMFFLLRLIGGGGRLRLLV